MFIFSFGYTQASDTAITSRVTYHFKLADGTPVDSVVEKTYTVKSKQKMTGLVYVEPVRNPHPRNNVYTITNSVQNDWNGFNNYLLNWKQQPHYDEIFIGNIEKSSITTYKKKYKTLRTEKIAYDIKGNILPGYVPAYVKSEEYNKVN